MNRRQLVLAASASLLGRSLNAAPDSLASSKLRAMHLMIQLNNMYEVVQRQGRIEHLEVTVYGADIQDACAVVTRLQEDVKLDERILLTTWGVKDRVLAGIRGHTRMAVLFNPSLPYPVVKDSLDLSLRTVALRLGWTTSSLWFAYPNYR